MLTTYAEVRDRIYELARKGGYRVDWIDDSVRDTREVLLYDSRQHVLARAYVPVRHVDMRKLAKLANTLEHLFGEGWMN